MKRYQQLQEEHLKTTIVKAMYEDVMADIYKNPKSIRKMMPWMRGVVDKKGDLYVVDYDTDKYDPHSIIHIEFIDWLKVNTNVNVGNVSRGNPLDLINWIITVVRYYDTNNFILAESYHRGDYEKFPEMFESYFRKAEKKTGFKFQARM